MTAPAGKAPTAGARRGLLLLDQLGALARWVRRGGAAAGRGLRGAWSQRAVRIACSIAVTVILLPPAVLVAHVYFDRSDLPDLAAFILFQPPTTGEIVDARGEVVVQLAREYRRVVTYDQVPLVVRQAILAAEDRNFESHSGVDYSALPRVIEKTLARSLAEWKKGSGLRLRLPQGGSTITQQLVRVYFLGCLTARRDDDALFAHGLTGARVLASTLGARAANKLLRKLEEVRLALWLEDAMRREYGTREQAKREIFARYASFIYMGSSRYGFGAASEYYFEKPLASYTMEDAGRAALLAGIAKSPRDYAPVAGSSRALRRRNQILALMARNGYIPEDLARRCQAEPIGVIPRAVKIGAPAVIEHVLAELQAQGGGRFAVEDLFQGRIRVASTVDRRVQKIVNEALENGLAAYEKRHPSARGLVQGSVVVLANADAAILAEAGGRQRYKLRQSRYSDYNRVTDSLRQPGSAMKPLVYLAAFGSGLTLDETVPDEPISVPIGSAAGVKWIANYDDKFKGLIPARQALAESRNAVAVWIADAVGMEKVIRTCRDLGVRTPVQPYISTALGASEVRLLELAGAYRAMASGVRAEPHVIARVTDSSGALLYNAPGPGGELRLDGVALIQEGLRGVIRLPGGTAHALCGRRFPIPVMGKTGTTSDFRDALFVGSTYGPLGITVAVRIGFDDNRTLGNRETGGRAALPVFREILARVYKAALVGPAPEFPRDMEARIDAYLARPAPLPAGPEAALPVADAGPQGEQGTASQAFRRLAVSQRGD
ncbi:MAG: transglycosylase domain-containing protein [Verrucomicrobia bacterium]|nr:transglycosylase domain-containing protein [Verrucomicrobiota bacterium]